MPTSHLDVPAERATMQTHEATHGHGTLRMYQTLQRREFIDIPPAAKPKVYMNEMNKGDKLHTHMRMNRGLLSLVSLCSRANQRTIISESGVSKPRSIVTRKGLSGLFVDSGQLFDNHTKISNKKYTAVANLVITNTENTPTKNTTALSKSRRCWQLGLTAKCLSTRKGSQPSSHNNHTRTTPLGEGSARASSKNRERPARQHITTHGTYAPSKNDIHVFQARINTSVQLHVYVNIYAQLIN